MINTEASVGGAAQAMFRLHQGFILNGHKSNILAKSNSAAISNAYEIAGLGTGSRASIYSGIEKFKQIVASKYGIPFTKFYTTRNIVNSKLFSQADVINLHNLHGYYFDYHLLPEITAKKPTIWTLHDMWSLTGHCAYSYDCQRWQSGCYQCPLLKKSGRQFVEPKATIIDRTRSIWRDKKKIYRNSQFHIVTPSLWLAQKARNSELVETASIHCIPYGLDLSTFCPRSREKSRWALNIPQDAKVILFLANNVNNERKGFRYLSKALSLLPRHEALMLVVVGSGTVANDEFGYLNVRNLGRISDERLLSVVYSSADILVFPSLADNLPLVIMEALACGTPVVAFNVGGVPEMVGHMRTGYLAHYKDSEDLTNGLGLLLREDSLRDMMAQNCRQVADSNFSNQLQVDRYQSLFQEVILSFNSR